MQREEITRICESEILEAGAEHNGGPEIASVADGQLRAGDIESFLFADAVEVQLNRFDTQRGGLAAGRGQRSHGLGIRR